MAPLTGGCFSSSLSALGREGKGGRCVPFHHEVGVRKGNDVLLPPSDDLPRKEKEGGGGEEGSANHVRPGR